MKSPTQILGGLFPLATLLHIRVKCYIQTLWSIVCFNKNILVLITIVLFLTAVKHTLCSIWINSFLFLESKLCGKTPVSEQCWAHAQGTNFFWVTEYYFKQGYLKDVKVNEINPLLTHLESEVRSCWFTCAGIPKANSTTNMIHRNMDFGFRHS